MPRTVSSLLTTTSLALAGLALVAAPARAEAAAQAQTAPTDGSAPSSSAGTGASSAGTDRPAAAAGNAAGQIGEIIVTAQRRTENLQRVPISAQVVGSVAIAQQNLNTIVDLAEQNPSIHVEATGRNTEYFIRGTGSGDNQSFDQSVGTFIDDIYHGRSRASSASFLDLDHVEVLKGPQSTFFGNNAIAGAFNIVTKKPDQQFGGWARALISPTSGENGGQYAVEGAINVPLTDNLSLRVAGTANGLNGYLYDVVTGKRGYGEDNYAFRATLRYSPRDRVDVILKGEYGHSLRTPGLVGRQVACPPPAIFGPPAGFCAINLANGDAYGLRSNKYAANDGGERRLNTAEGVLTVNYPVGPATLTSVTGYYGYDFNFNLDNDITRLPLLNVQAPESYHQFSQELRITSPTGHPIEYLAGLYYQDDTLHIRQSVNFFFLNPVVSSIPPFAPLVPYLPLGQQILAGQHEHAYSAFASVTWNITDRFKLVGGLRGSIVDKSFNWNLAYGTATQAFGGIVDLPDALQPLASALGTGNAGAVALHREDKALMPSARLQYQFQRDTMAYFNYSRGFKAGGFSVADVTANPANFPFKP